MRYLKLPWPDKIESGIKLSALMGSLEVGSYAALPIVDVDVLISGAGPAGASLACFLASHGKSCIMHFMSSRWMRG